MSKSEGDKMIFTPYASGSSGNLYTLSGGKTTVMIEAGVPFTKIKKALNFQLHDIDAVLISHSHMDHAKSVKDVVNCGIDCYMLQETANKLGLQHHRVKLIEPLKQFRVGDLKILPFEIQHDVPGVGFLIQDPTGDKALYATDTYYIRYRFVGLNIIAIECNYASDILYDNIEKGLVQEGLKNRLLQSHFSLDNVKKFLQANDLSKVQEIWLLHLSDGNSDAERFKREIQELTGKMVFIP
jgi:phosphoribosyl 1,2-cyclic phosphodiesterase